MTNLTNNCNFWFIVIIILVTNKLLFYKLASKLITKIDY